MIGECLLFLFNCNDNMISYSPTIVASKQCEYNATVTTNRTRREATDTKSSNRHEERIVLLIWEARQEAIAGRRGRAEVLWKRSAAYGSNGDAFLGFVG